MRDQDLDVTLRSGELVNRWLAGWLLAAAETPNKVRAVVIAARSDGTAVELQDDEGIATGGILYVTARGAVHVLGAIDPQNEPFTKRRSPKELRAAQTIALRARMYRDRCVKTYEACLYGVLPLLVLAVLWIFARWVW
jgi:hypothetical protein